MTLLPRTPVWHLICMYVCITETMISQGTRLLTKEREKKFISDVRCHIEITGLIVALRSSTL